MSVGKRLKWVCAVSVKPLMPTHRVPGQRLVKVAAAEAVVAELVDLRGSRPGEANELARARLLALEVGELGGSVRLGRAHLLAVDEAHREAIRAARSAAPGDA